jgi:hypothetical protein
MWEESFVYEEGIESGCLNRFLMLLRVRSAWRRMINNVFFFVLSQVSHFSCCGASSSRSQQRH